MDTADSREEEAKKLPPECQVAHEERKQQAMPAREDVCPAGMESSLYLNWHHMQVTPPKKTDKTSPYKMPKEETEDKLSLEDELNADSVFDPLASQLSEAPGSQPSGVPSSQHCDETSPGSESTGPKTRLHFSEGPITIPPFDVSVLGIPNKSAALSPMTDQENTLLNLVPGSPVKSVGLFLHPE